LGSVSKDKKSERETGEKRKTRTKATKRDKGGRRRNSAQERANREGCLLVGTKKKQSKNGDRIAGH